jgi:predicted NAD-dependent protein-ADP-ribosyltransferase YbiA (DUF1768 family)
MILIHLILLLLLLLTLSMSLPIISDLITRGVFLPYASKEHYYHAAKAVRLQLPSLARHIQMARTSYEAKRLGEKTAMAAFVANLENWSDPMHVSDAFLAAMGTTRNKRPSKEDIREYIIAELQ